MALHKFSLSILLALSMGSTYAHTTNKTFFKVLTPNQIKKILGPYPAKGSVEEAQDFETLLQYQENRTEEECALAESEKKATFEKFFVGENRPLTKKEANHVYPLVLKLYAEGGLNIYIAKSVYKRPRPYLTNPQIKPCIDLEKSYAYPSGHTAMSRLFARVIGRVYPEKREALLKRADEVANHRILGGVHHPSDIRAGKKLADVIAGKIIESPVFQQELKKL